VGSSFAFAAEAGQPQQLHVVGNRLYNEAGEQVKIVGTCICSMEWAGGEKMMDKFKMSLDNWNSNVIRLPISDAGWYGTYWWISDNGASYQNDVRSLVDYATSKGKYVILDLHRFGWLTDTHIGMWKELVAQYKNEPGVMFNMLNEPHTTPWPVWYGGGTVTSGGKQVRAYGMQECMDMIRGMGAKNIIVQGGLDWSYQLYALVPGYDGRERGYQLLEPEDENLKGYGVVYDTHIYPWKGGEASWANMVGVAFPYVPVFSGECGHTNERLADWFDDTYYEYATIWNNQLLNYYEQNEVNYNAWCFHQSSAPAALRNTDNYAQTPYSGLIQKFWLVYAEENNMPPVEERDMVDEKPVYEWLNTMNFDDVKAESIKVYKETDDTYIATELRSGGIDGSNCQIIAFDIPEGQENKAAAITEFPSDWKYDGATLLTFRWRGDGDMRDMTVGIELTDGRQFKVTYPINMNKNWQRQFFSLDALKGEYGLLDTDKIKYFFVSPASSGKGSFSIDDVVIGGLNPVEKENKKYVDDNSVANGCNWTAWADNENSRTDVFNATRTQNEGMNGTPGMKFTYVRPEGSYGGQAAATFPSGWNLENVNYMTFDIRSDGSVQELLFRIDKAAPQKKTFYKREFERFAKRITISGDKWTHVVWRMSDFAMSETFEMEKLKYLNVFNMTPNSSGTFYIDNLSFYTDYDLGLKDKYVLHPEPVESERITNLPQEYEDNIIYQFCNEEVGVAAAGAKMDDDTGGAITTDTTGTIQLTAGSKNYLHFTMRNKTDEKAQGLLAIEGLPEGTVFEENGQYIPYTIVWREENSVYFAFTLPSDARGIYKIRVIDTNAKGVETKEYTVNIN
jgi:hypothetical protein